MDAHDRVAGPASTYRLQVSPAFGLDDAAAVTDYLAALGVGAVYTSPLLQAAPGSTHGYDVTDHSHANDELGGEAARRRLAAAAEAHGLGFVLDVVPNHVSVAVPTANRWWWDVLAKGPGSAYATWFDIDFSRGRLVLPVLGEDPGELDALVVRSSDDGPVLCYHDLVLPVADGTAGPGDDPRTVHDRQHYRLVSWRRGAPDLPYRRFFDVTTLAGIRVEDPAVFDASHAELLRWVADGDVTGLRIDHPDGLADPAGYLDRLAAAAPGTWVVVEKILEPGEPLPDSWACAGTTGYDALREVCGLFVDPAGKAPLAAAYTELTGLDGSDDGYAALTHDLKLYAATNLLRAELNRLAGLLPTEPDALPATAEVLASLPVYRTYLPGGSTEEQAHDREVVAAAVAAARRHRPDLAAVLARVEQELLAGASAYSRRFQQTSGMVMAKGVEDTAFYRFNRMVALNEVGGDPRHFGVEPDTFHVEQSRQQRSWPTTMTCLSTHDTKRSEDVRARLAVLSEIPEEWAAIARQLLDLVPAPDANTAYLLLQTAVGAWPLSVERARAYLAKASREAKQRTSWTAGADEVDADIAAYAERLLTHPQAVAVIGRFVERVRPAALVNSVGQKLVQLTLPGVPDVYQGTECEDLSLVDPDNRRPVDFGRRRDVLAELDAGGPPDPADLDRVKLLVTSRALRLRRDRAEAFTTYRPLAAGGPAADHLVAYDRGGAVTCATRLPVGLARAGGWGDTTLDLPLGPWVDVLAGRPHQGTVAVGDVLHRYPVALLARPAAGAAQEGSQA